LEERPFVGELADPLRTAVEQVRGEPAPAASVARALDRARRLGPGKVNPWLQYHRIAVAAAVAAVLMLTFGLLLVCWRFEPPGPSGGPRPPLAGASLPVDGDVPVGVDRGPARPGGPGALAAGGDGRPAENPFAEANRTPVSTFTLAYDPAVYAGVRRALLDEKRLPPPDAVRVAELVNAFSYSYPEPDDGRAVSLTVDLAECPWHAGHHLARVGVRGRAGEAVPGAAVEVRFNPRRVTAYRLIGYEGGGRQRDSAGEELPAGRAVTALYELALEGGADGAECLSASVLYWDAGRGAETRLEHILAGPAKRFTDAPADFRFAAAAAEFGLLLRGSDYKGQATYADVRAAAQGALGADADGRRAEFLALVDAADRLTADHKITRRDGRVS
jgi:hypothetical protein